MKKSELKGIIREELEKLKEEKLKSIKYAVDSNGKLPYDWDLFFDIKNLNDINDVMNNKPTRVDASPEELQTFAKKQGYFIPTPFKLGKL